VKNHIIANNSATIEATEKISTFGILTILEFFGGMFSKFENYKFSLIKLATYFLIQPSYVGSERASLGFKSS